LRAIGVARNYAEVLLALAEKAGPKATEGYADLMDAVAAAMETSPQIHAVLLSPRVAKARKASLLAAGLKGAPREFVTFLQMVVKRGRQGLFREISNQYLGLVDLKLNRVRAGITTAKPADAALRKKIVEALTRVIGKEVLGDFQADPALLGGILVRVGDRVFDGSIRRRAVMLKRQLLAR
jgi:F-type H+-transporting ATPase subunit delta